MIILLHYLPKLYDNTYTVTTESFHNVWVLLIVMTLDCLRLFTQSAELISLGWLEMARNDSTTFTELNSLAVCENMKIGLPDRRTIQLNGHVFLTGLTELRLAVAVKGSPKFSLQVRWECRTHSKVILLSLQLQLRTYSVTQRWTKFDRTREKMSPRHVLFYLMIFRPNLNESCLTWCLKVSFQGPSFALFASCVLLLSFHKSFIDGKKVLFVDMVCRSCLILAFCEQKVSNYGEEIVVRNRKCHTQTHHTQKNPIITRQT